MEPETTSILKEINAKLDAVQRSMTVLADVVNPNIGIERIWPNRRSWASDPSAAGMTAWKKRVCQAQRVDIVSHTLWTGWFNDKDFRKEFFQNMVGGAAARILIYDPRSEIMQLRASDEGDPRGQMQIEIGWTLETIAHDKEILNDAVKRNLQVRLTTRFYHLAQIIRADDHILAAVYLSGKSGGPSPTFQVRGPETEYFRTYAEQVEILWERGRTVSDKEFMEYGARPQPLPQPQPTLRQLLIDYLSDDELRDLCLDLHVDYESLPGAGKGSKARELVAYFERRGIASVLIEKCRQLRPNVSWWDAL